MLLYTFQRGLRFETVIVQLKRAELRSHGDIPAVVAHRGFSCFTGLIGGEAVCTGGYLDACCESFDVPFEGAGQCLVKIIEVEYQFAAGCAVSSSDRFYFKQKAH